MLALMNLIATLIENYDVSDIINQTVIMLLLGLLIIQYRLHVRIGKTRYDY
jgi:hypothetical protein